MATVTLASLQNMRKELVNSRYYLNIRSGYMAPVTLHCSYGDSGETITFYIFDGGDELDLTGSVVTVHGTRKDGANFGPFACTTVSNEVSFELQSAMTAVEGGGIAEFTISKSDTVIGTCNFGIMVEDAVFPNGVAYDSDPSVYQDILAYVQSIPASLTSDYLIRIQDEMQARITADGQIGSELSTEIANRTTAETNLSKRIDSIVGQTTSDSEITEARVSAARDGSVTYSSLGAAIRGQVTNLYDYVDTKANTAGIEYPRIKNGTINNSINTKAVAMCYTESFFGCDSVTFKVNKSAVTGYHYSFNMFYCPTVGLETGTNEFVSSRWYGADVWRGSSDGMLTIPNLNDDKGKAFAVSIQMQSDTSDSDFYTFDKSYFSEGDIVIIRNYNMDVEDVEGINSIITIPFTLGSQVFTRQSIDSTNGNPFDSTTRVASHLMVDVSNAVSIRIVNTSSTYKINPVFFTKRHIGTDGFVRSNAPWYSEGTSVQDVPKHSGKMYAVFLIAKVGDGDITIDEAQTAFNSGYFRIYLNPYDGVLLNINPTTGDAKNKSIDGTKGNTYDTTTRVLFYDTVCATGLDTLEVTDIPEGYKFLIMCYRTKTIDMFGFISNESGYSWASSDFTFQLPTGKRPLYLAYIVAKTDDSAITPTEAIDAIKQMTLIGRGSAGVSIPSTLFNSSNVKHTIDVTEKTTEFADVVGTGTGESFIFFTDPHTFPHLYNKDANEYLITLIQKYFNSTSTSFVLCGGDWLQDMDTKQEAKQRLAYIDGFMNGMFNDNYYPILGNHDTNYQGVDTTGDEFGTGELDRGIVDNLMFRRWNKAYYAFDGINTRFYVLDSQVDNPTAMDTYKWSQIDFLATSLKDEDKTHSSVAIHIWWNSQDQTSTPVPIAQNVASVVTAYNNRTSVTLNSKTYNFTSCTGHVEFIIAGHTHKDMNNVVGTIPIVASINAGYGNNAFDLVYADYTARRLYMIRVGTGSNRTFNLDTGALIS